MNNGAITGKLLSCLAACLLLATLPQAMLAQTTRPMASRPATTQATSTQPAGGDLIKAIAALRRIDRANMTEERAQKMGMVVQEAWATIRDSGSAGAAALKEEVRKIDQAKEKDDFFKLSAAALMWEAWSLQEANSIAEIFRATPLSEQSNYVFYTAFLAAQTQDERVVPILKATLRDDKVHVFVAQHAMHVVWPLTEEFIWGCYGAKGLPVLAKALEESNDPVELQAAMDTLALGQYLPALPRIRQLAKHANPAVAGMAIQALGKFGHPDDYDFLAAGLKTTDSGLLFNYVFAAWEFGDMRMVPALVPLMGSSDKKVAEETATTLVHLMNPAALDAIAGLARQHKDDGRAKYCQEVVDSFLSAAKLTFEEYSGKSPREKEALLADMRVSRQGKFRLKDADRRLTHEQFLEAVAEWKKAHRLAGGKYEWVQDRHVLGVATPDDLPLLYDVRAAVLARLSDECLGDAEIMTDLMQRIGRSRYRAAAGVTDKVVPPTSSQPGAQTPPATGG
jgi:hypothetical protein